MNTATLLYNNITKNMGKRELYDGIDSCTIVSRQGCMM